MTILRLMIDSLAGLRPRRANCLTRSANRLHSWVRVMSIGLIAASACPLVPAQAASFVEFESGQVRPLARSPNGQRLYAVNTPDNRLEGFAINSGGLTPIGSVPVGLEPVAVAVRNNNEVWVVNHLSDSISILNVSGASPRVVRTLLVGDEPRDIVFAGPGGNRAFITTAHRGQNSPVNPQLTTPGVGRADVWVFDANNLGSTLGGTPLTIITLFTDTPRALAVSPDGGTVYAAGFHTGNRTTAIHEGAVCDRGAGADPCVPVPGNGDPQSPGGLPLPNKNDDITLPDGTVISGTKQRETGLIVKFNGSNWLDELSRIWDPMVRFSLPDKDVFTINANGNPPVLVGSFAGVGTVLYNMAVNPVSGKLYVSNTEALNEVRFEGEPNPERTTVQGRLHQTRISIIGDGKVMPRHLNKHILPYSTRPVPAGVKPRSLSIPTGMAVSSNGSTLYLAAFGSAKVGIFLTSTLEDGSFQPSAANHIPVSGGGPSGLVLDEARNRLYVMTRFDNSISVVNTVTRAEISHVAMRNPEPASVVNGRRFLYDATLTSSNGESSCGSCHVFGDFDSLAWDLGNPGEIVEDNPNPFLNHRPPPLPPGGLPFHPMKGPMTTQSLRGMAKAGPMHWRGDRTGGGAGIPNNQPDMGAFDEVAAFKKFNPAFMSLLGSGAQLSESQMQAFTDFILQVTYPPNPIRALDNSLTPDQAEGKRIYFSEKTDGGACNSCHVLDPANGFFGTGGGSSFEGEPQQFKVAHLRNIYQKIGMFGMPAVESIRPGDNGFMGDQIRGYGLLHDGAIDSVFRFINADVFKFPGDAPGMPAGTGDLQRRQVEQFVLAFDSNLAPVVGQQVTLSITNAAVANPRINLLVARANADECDLVVKGNLVALARGWHFGSDALFHSDKSAELALTDASLRSRAQTAGQELTYTCTPPGSGVRMGIDRDEDGILDGDEA